MAQNTHKGTENLASSMFALRTPSVGFYGGQLYVFFIYIYFCVYILTGNCKLLLLIVEPIIFITLYFTKGFRSLFIINIHI